MRRWLSRHGGPLVVLAATVVAMVYVYVTHHQIFPDTQLYLGWTYRLMGYHPAEAERLVADYIRSDGVFEPYGSLWNLGILELSYRPRMLLPLLSVPFVAVFGPGGIVVVPGIAFALAVYVMYRFAALHAGVPAAVVACVLAVASFPVVVWSVGGLTDSLALLLHAVTFLLLPWRSPATRWRLAGLVAVTALAATARFIAPYPLFAVAALWLWARVRGRDRRAWTAAAAAVAVGSAIGMLWTRWATSPMTVMTQLTATTGGEVRRYRDLPTWYAENLPGRLGTEAGHILDSWPLAVLVALSLIACVIGWRTIAPWLVVPAWLAALTLFLLNPYVTAFRLELPVLPATIAAAAIAVDRAVQRGRATGTGRCW